MIAFEYVAAGLAGYLLLFYLGWPLWTALAPSPCPISVSLGAPLVGLAALQVISWYWLDNSGLGWSTGFPLLLGVNAVAIIACFVWKRPTLRIDRSLAFSVLAVVAVIVATSALFVSHFDNVVTRGDQLEGASSNSPDTPAYAVISRFVHDHDFSTFGPIAGYDIGKFAREDVFGVFPLVDGTATVAGIGDWQALLPSILVAMLLVALALRDLANCLFPNSRTRGTVVALVASASFLFAYIQGLGYLSQLLAMPIAVALATVYFGVIGQSKKSEFFRSIALVGLLDIVLAVTYPHMLFLAQPVLVGAALVATIGPGWAVRARRVLVVAAGGVIVAAIVIPQRFSIAFSKFQSLAKDQTSGFPLAAFTPFQLLGFQRTLTVPSRATLVIQAVIVLAVVCGALVVLWREDRRAGIFCTAMVTLVLGSYGLVYLVRGQSYTQWKWISFFQPLYAALVILVVCAAAATLLRRVHVNATLRLVAGLVAGAVLMVVVVRDTRVLTKTDTFLTRVPTSLSTLEGNRALAGIDAVNVNLPPFWETMWSVYFLTPRGVYLQNASEYAVVPPQATWTLEPSSTPVQPGEIVRQLNRDYKLVRKAPTGG